MKPMKALGLMALVAILTAPVAFASGGSSSPKSSIPEATQTPEQQAMDHYNNGLGLRDRAEKLEEKLATMTEGDKRDKTEKKLANAWESAASEFMQSVQKNPAYYRAYASLGYVLRRSGDYEKSLEAYNRALALEPDYTEAIEYRAEAYLGLNRVEDAKAAYDKLIEMNRDHALELLDAMKKWVEVRRAAPDGVSAQTVNELDRWIDQSAAAAGDTVGHVMPGRKKDW